MAGVHERVVHHIEGLPEGTPVGARGLLHLGSRAAVDQALSRLVRQQRLIRLGRGLYVRPVAGRFGQRPPAESKVLAAISRLRGETITPHGAAAANRLGLTEQVPVRTIYLTSGRSRSLRLGSRVIELRHAPQWQLALPEERAGEVIRALEWLGPVHARHAFEKLQPPLSPAEWETLASACMALPTWLAEVIARARPEAPLVANG